MPHESPTPPNPDRKPLYDAAYFKDTFANMSPKERLDLDVTGARNIHGYEAAFDPDSALGEKAEHDNEMLEELTGPQHTPFYLASEGDRQHEVMHMIYSAKDVKEIVDGMRKIEGNHIGSHQNGTHDLTWEGKKEVTVDSDGLIITDHTL